MKSLPLTPSRTTCASLLHELQTIWDENGESESARDKMLIQLEQECLDIYRRKVDFAKKHRADLHQSSADADSICKEKDDTEVLCLSDSASTSVPSLSRGGHNGLTSCTKSMNVDALGDVEGILGAGVHKDDTVVLCLSDSASTSVPSLSRGGHDGLTSCTKSMNVDALGDVEGILGAGVHKDDTEVLCLSDSASTSVPSLSRGGHDGLTSCTKSMNVDALGDVEGILGAGVHKDDTEVLCLSDSASTSVPSLSRGGHDGLTSCTKSMNVDALGDVEGILGAGVHKDDTEVLCLSDSASTSVLSLSRVGHDELTSCTKSMNVDAFRVSLSSSVCSSNQGPGHDDSDALGDVKGCSCSKTCGCKNRRCECKRDGSLCGSQCGCDARVCENRGTDEKGKNIPEPNGCACYRTGKCMTKGCYCRRSQICCGPQCKCGPLCTRRDKAH